MSPQELQFFSSNLEKLDTVNKAYVWRILMDHVNLGQAKITDFMSVLFNKFGEETNEELVSFILRKVSTLHRLGFID